MKRNNTVLILVFCLVFCTVTQLLTAQDPATLVMVVGKGSPVGQVSRVEAKKLLTGETSTWSDGQKVVVILKPAGSPDRAAILKKICGMTETTYTRYELQASFTGETSAVITVAPSDAAVKATLKTNLGAVGFLHKNEVDDSVKIVFILD
jgi:ABC-type phosphate transport system substrate-binding protein